VSAVATTTPSASQMSKFWIPCMLRPSTGAPVAPPSG
jgi:hypothetical protein